MWPNPQETADLVAFTEEILNGKLNPWWFYLLKSIILVECVWLKGKFSHWMCSYFGRCQLPIIVLLSLLLCLYFKKNLGKVCANLKSCKHFLIVISKVQIYLSGKLQFLINRVKSFGLLHFLDFVNFDYKIYLGGVLYVKLEYRQALK